MIRLSNKALHTLALGFALSLVLYLCYLLTYTGIRLTGDERTLIDATESIAITQQAWLNQTVDLLGVTRKFVEPAQPLLAAPLYWLAYHIQWIGNVHAVLLFNPLVTAATGCVLFLFATARGYRRDTAVIATLLFGLTTIAWPYTQTFFREPLAGFALLSAGFFIEEWRKRLGQLEGRHWVWILPSMLMTVILMASKDAMLLTIPALLALAYPRSEPGGKRSNIGPALALGILVAVFLALVFVLRDRTDVLQSRYMLQQAIEAFVQGLQNIGSGIAGYLLSPGKAVWWFSPVLLLVLGAPFTLPRSRWRESWLPLALLVWFAVGYAAIKGEHWFGGAGWGARYLVPVIPFIMLGTLPSLEHTLTNGSRLLKAIVLALSLSGIVVQLVGVYVDIFSYDKYVEEVTGQPGWMGPALWSIRWSQPVGGLAFIPYAKTNIRWLTPIIDGTTIGILSVGIVGASLLALWLQRAPELTRRKVWSLIGILPAITVIFTIFTVSRAFDDPRYQLHVEGLASLGEYLTEHAAPEDTILLSNGHYEPYFANYYKGRAIWFTLPLSPGERYSWEEEPEVVSASVADLIHPISVDLIHRLTKPESDLYSGGAIWLVVDSGPYHPWATRPPEWYLAKRAYTLQAEEFHPAVRLLAYAPLTAPGLSAPSTPVGARFGDSIRLSGFDLAGPEHGADRELIHAGEFLSVSLLWETLTQVDEDYTISVQLVDQYGNIVLQQDRQPLGGFAPTNTWEAGELFRDNYGFLIPETLVPGEYRLQVVMYHWPSLHRLPVVSSYEKELGDFLALTTISLQVPSS